MRVPMLWLCLCLSARPTIMWSGVDASAPPCRAVEDVVADVCDPEWDGSAIYAAEVLRDWASAYATVRPFPPAAALTALRIQTSTSSSERPACVTRPWSHQRAAPPTMTASPRLSTSSYAAAAPVDGQRVL